MVGENYWQSSSIEIETGIDWQEMEVDDHEDDVDQIKKNSKMRR